MAETSRQRHLRVKYGLTEKQFNELAAEYDGACWICRKVPKGRLQVDHQHTGEYAGEIRGLLCWRCNRYLHYWMTEEWLRTASLYVGARTLDGDIYGGFTGLFVPRKKKRKR